MKSKKTLNALTLVSFIILIVLCEIYSNQIYETLEKFIEVVACFILSVKTAFIIQDWLDKKSNSNTAS
jgi:uncharacterized membrane protein YcaP (DUF421 family)